MCQVTVVCCCGGRGRGGGDLMTLGLLVGGAVVVGPTLTVLVGAAVSMVAAIGWGLAVSAGIVTGGWVVKAIATQVIEQVGLTRHNKRMAAIHPNVARSLGYAPQGQLAPPLPAIEGRRKVLAEIVSIKSGD